MAAVVSDAVDPRRLGGAAFVLLLHALLIAGLLRATLVKETILSPSREVLLQFPQPASAPKTVPEKSPPPVRLLVPKAPSTTAITAPPATNGADLQGLHQSLFDCAPENFVNLTQEQQAQCNSAAIGPVPNTAESPRNLPSRAHDAPHWERALARKKNPVLLPCANPLGLALTPLLLACLGKGVVQGFDLDAQPGYGDAPPQDARVPNNGEPQVPDPMPH